MLVFQTGEYEDNVADNSTWSEGDWDGDGDFTSSDLIVAFQAGTYLSAAARPAAQPADTIERQILVEPVAAVRRERASDWQAVDSLFSLDAEVAWFEPGDGRLESPSGENEDGAEVSEA